MYLELNPAAVVMRLNQKWGTISCKKHDDPRNLEWS
jgi:hypothetical protein